MPTRRRALLAAGAAALSPLARAAAAPVGARAVRRGRLKQSVARWCYRQILPDFCRAMANMGLTATAGGDRTRRPRATAWRGRAA